MKLFWDSGNKSISFNCAAKFSHIAAAANFTRTPPRPASVSLDPDRMDSAKKWQTQVTHLSVDVFCVVEELLEEWQQAFVLGIQVVEHAAVEVFDFGLGVQRLGDFVVDLFERRIVFSAFGFEALLAQSQLLAQLSIKIVAHTSETWISLPPHKLVSLIWLFPRVTVSVNRLWLW